MRIELKSLSSAFLLILVSIGLVGCLQTQRELRGETPASTQTQKNRNQQQVQMQQQEQVPRSSYNDSGVDDQFRELRGRLDQLEYQSSQNQSGASASEAERLRLQQDLQTRFRAYEDALKNLEIQILGLVKDVDDLKKKEQVSASTASTSAKAGGDFERAEELFGKQQWRDAILAYQNYRDKNAKGKNYAEATYKIGVCFQELKMNDEARAFYNEVVAKFSKSGEARKARTRLQSLK